jgi:hypothetical protein
MAFTYMQVMRNGYHWSLVVYIFVSISSFFTANWEEHHLHVLRCCINGFGLTECQLCLVGLILL